MEKSFTLMSSNLCCWGNGDNAIAQRMPRVKALYREWMPDLIGTQETTLTWKNFLIDALPEYGAVGEKRENIADPEHCVIFYKKARFDLLSTETFALSPSGAFGSTGWGEQYPRICTFAVLLDRETQRKLSFFNLHLALCDQAQIPMLKMVLERAALLHLPTLLTGDFNAVEGSDAYRFCTQHFEDAKKAAADSDSGPTFHGFEGEYSNESCHGLPIDYCMAGRGEFSVSSYKILRQQVNGKPISDHYPVLATLALKDIPVR